MSFGMMIVCLLVDLYCDDYVDYSFLIRQLLEQGRIQDFKLGGGGGAHLKKLRRTEGGAKIVGVFRVKNYDFKPKNHIFFQF